MWQKGLKVEKETMLILTRSVGEQIMIGDDITIVVMDAYFNKGRREISIGIQAPRSIPIHRREIWEKIQRKEKDERVSESSSS